MIRILFLFSFFSSFLFAEWSSNDLSSILDRITSESGYLGGKLDIANNNLQDAPWSDTYNNSSGNYKSTRYGYAWAPFTKEMVMGMYSLKSGDDYYWDSDEGVEHIKSNNPYGNADDFDITNVKDNTGYYSNRIMNFMANGTYENDDRIPDQRFMNYPNKGNFLGAMTAYAENDGFGVNNIKNSQQTSVIRNEVTRLQQGIWQNLATSESAVNTGKYTFEWDFTSFGNVLVEHHVCNSNPFANLRGGIRLKPLPNDFHYAIWHNYFDTSQSYGLIVRYSIVGLLYVGFLFYCLNDLLAIVQA